MLETATGSHLEPWCPEVSKLKKCSKKPAVGYFQKKDYCENSPRNFTATEALKNTRLVN